jgi:hypothetical protein
MAASAAHHGRVDAADLLELTRLLQRPGAIAPADGLTVRVQSVRIAGARRGGELEIRYSVAPLPDGIARQPPPGNRDLVTYAAEVGEELQAWAIEHVRRHRPLPPADRDQIRRDLPSREELWALLRSEFQDVSDVDGGFVATNRDGRQLSVMLTPQTWQEYVVHCEIGCRNDYGVDADSAGSGPMVAMGYLEEVMATLDAEEFHVVLDGHALHGSTRTELPPVPGTAWQREQAEVRRRGGGRWVAQ